MKTPHWTKHLPTVGGFYWYRHTPQSSPEVVVFQLRGGPEFFLTYVWRFATAKTLGGMIYDPISGEFWSEEIKAP